MRSVALPGPNGVILVLSWLNSGTGALSLLLWQSQRAILSSPSAVMQGAELLSALTPSTAFSLEPSVVAGSHTLTDVISGSGSGRVQGRDIYTQKNHFPLLLCFVGFVPQYLTPCLCCVITIALLHFPAPKKRLSCLQLEH